MAATISVVADDFALLYREVQKIDKELAKNLRKRLTAIAQPVRDEVRAAALGIPSRGTAYDTTSSKGVASALRKKRGSNARSGLRASIAASIETKVQPSKPGRFSIRIRASGTKFSARAGRPASLTRYMEGRRVTKKEWRHPVFGDMEAWTGQASHPYMLDTVMRHKAQVYVQVRSAVQETVDTVLARKLRG